MSRAVQCVPPHAATRVRLGDGGCTWDYGEVWPGRNSEPYRFNYYKDGYDRKPCTARLEGTNEDINICYYEIKCLEEESQWDSTATHVHGEKFQLSERTMNSRSGDPKDSRFNWPRDGARRFSWQGGLNPANVTYANPTPTTGYTEGKFCLQKAALKALSRRGWELIQPSEAFEPSRYYDYNYRNPLREDVYASKTFKVIKRTLAM